MKNIFAKLIMFGMVVVLLGGCASTDENANPPENNSTTNETTEETVAITISEGEGEDVLDEKEVAIEEEAILMDVLKENFDVDEEGGFINGIGGVVADEDEDEFWSISVNGEEAEVGAEDYELAADDDVVLDLQSWQ